MLTLVLDLRHRVVEYSRTESNTLQYCKCHELIDVLNINISLCDISSVQFSLDQRTLCSVAHRSLNYSALLQFFTFQHNTTLRILQHSRYDGELEHTCAACTCVYFERLVTHYLYMSLICNTHRSTSASSTTGSSLSGFVLNVGYVDVASSCPEEWACILCGLRWPTNACYLRSFSCTLERSNGPRFESGRGHCVESLDKALYSHCPKEKPSHTASISYLAILVKYILAKKKC